MKVSGVLMLAVSLSAVSAVVGCGGTRFNNSILRSSVSGAEGSSAAGQTVPQAAPGHDAGTSLSSELRLGPGEHMPHVRGILRCFTCPGENLSSALSLVPSTALQTNAIQSLTGWFAATDAAGGGGTANGVTKMIAAPSMSGATRVFTTTFSSYGDERYAVSFGADTASNNFLYDGWIYIAAPSNGIANLEMDLNQVLANGQTVIYGFQCDGYSGTWDYTENKGTPEAPNDVWVHSGATCNPRSWTTNTWHHVQIGFARDNAGNVTYQSVWLDGTKQTLNATVPSAFALGWGSTLLTNFQVDGLGAGGSSTVYLDNLTVYRWIG